MKPTTKELENKIDKAQSVDELRKIISELPKTTFYDRLNELMKKYDMGPADIVRSTGMIKSLVYDITSARGKRKPQRYQILRIAVAMRLTIEELNELLKLANYKELYAKSKVDNVIRFGLQKNLPDEEIEELLIDVGAPFSLFE